MKARGSKWIIFLLIGIALLPMVAFFVPGLPHGHDAQDHVVRITNFYKGLTEGIWFPRWGGNLNWGYGHPVMMFLYPCSSYVASFFRAIGFSFVDATKAVFVVAYIGSVLSMYLFMSTVWGKRAGIIGAILYGFAPYRFVDIYVRMAIGEHMAFVFPPLILYFLYNLATQKRIKPQVFCSKYGVGLSVTFGLLILSHNAIALMFLPIIGLYGIYLFFFEAKKSLSFILHTLSFILLGFGVAAFFWIPGFIEGKYTLRNIVTAGEALKRFVPFSSFFYSPWTYGGAATLTKEVGIAQWFGFLASLVVIVKTKDKKLRTLLIVSCLLFVVFLFIMTEASWWIWKQVMILQNFQFPVRFLSPVVFLSALIGGVAVTNCLEMLTKRGVQKKMVVLYTIVFCLLPIISTMHMWHPKDYQVEKESFYTRVYPGTTDTGESTPIWTTRFQEQYPKAPLEIISGQGSIQQTKRTTTVHEYTVTSSSERIELMENTLYFPGWTVTIDGQQIVPEFQSEIHRGIMTFWVPEGTHQVRVAFINTKVRMIGEIVTVVSLILLAGNGFLCIIWKRKP